MPVHGPLRFQMKILLAFLRCLALRNMVIRNMPTYLPMHWLRCSSPWTHTRAVEHLLLPVPSGRWHGPMIMCPSQAVPLCVTTLSRMVTMLGLDLPRSCLLTCSSWYIMAWFPMTISVRHIVLLNIWTIYFFLAVLFFFSHEPYVFLLFSFFLDFNFFGAVFLVLCLVFCLCPLCLVNRRCRCLCTVKSVK